MLLDCPAEHIAYRLGRNPVAATFVGGEPAYVRPDAAWRIIGAVSFGSADAERTFPLGAGVTLEQLDHDPHPALAALREHEPVSWLPALGGWLVTRYDLAVARDARLGRPTRSTTPVLDAHRSSARAC